MKHKKLLIILTAIAVSIVLISLTTQDDEHKEKLVVNKTYEILKIAHYNPQDLNDEFSQKIYDLYLQSLDYSKLYFTQEQITVLGTYKTLLDDEIKGQTLNFFNLSYELLNTQLAYVQSIYPTILAEPFDYSKDEFIEIDQDKRTFFANNNELKDFWRKYLKYQVLDEIFQKEQEQTKQKEKSDTVVLKSFDTLEAQARKRIIKRYDSRFKRINKITKEDRFDIYVNSITGAFDPHTNYFPPKDKEDFDIQISGKLEGIGATLSEKDGYTKVVNIVPGSPSWKQGELQTDDIILKVAQGDGEAVDIVDMRLDEAVQLIRGPKGTKVMLTVKKVDGNIVKIPIIRDVVVLEDAYAKSAILTSENDEKQKVGYIHLPQFYTDMNDYKGRRCADDMKKEIKKLSECNVSGIIVDLRNNGGGSLHDVVKIGGYFIPTGPIVQVKNYDGQTDVLRDLSPDVLYEGPLVILINTFSASASEILAAAMQDYKRAVIVGTTSYGKGTVQRFVDIDRFVESSQNHLKPLGSIKLTIQKFYRINGGSTQLKGVTPDIILPSVYQKIDIGEKELDYPLKWTNTSKQSYNTYGKEFDIKKLAKNSEQRVSKDSTFILINSSADWLYKQKENTNITLNYTTYTSNEKLEKLESKKYKDADKRETALIASTLTQTNDTTALDSIKANKTKKWHKDLKQDVELFETYRIMIDLISQ